MNLSSVYKGKKVFVTGHTGFKGAWITIWLKMLGAELKGYSLPPDHENNLYPIIDGDKLCKSVIGDIRDFEKLKEEILSFQPDFIFHLAAQPLVRLSYQIPIDTFNTNVIGTAHVLEALRFLDKPCVVIMITTDKVYHNKESDYLYKETDRLGGYDPYSASKAAAELVIDSYCKSFFNVAEYDKHHKTIAVARAGNVIGGGDWAVDRIIPDIVRALSKNAQVPIRNPNAVRPWQHVLEPLRGYLVLGAKLYQQPKGFSLAWNFGPNEEGNLTVESLVKIAIEHWESGSYTIAQEKSALHEAQLLKLDIAKAGEDLLWKPKWDAGESIQKTILWYKHFFLNKKDMRRFTEQQISNYDTESFT